MQKVGKTLMILAIPLFLVQLIGHQVGYNAAGSSGNVNPDQFNILLGSTIFLALVGLILYMIGKHTPMADQVDVPVDYDGGWICPNCGLTNLHTESCEKCGYIPKQYAK